MSSSPFLILALPRSRTRWLAAYLTYPPFSCGHEEARHWRNIADVRAWLSQPNTGTCETAIVRWWRLIPKLHPSLKIVVVRRPIDECVESLMRLDLGGDFNFDRSRLRVALIKHDRALDTVERHLSPLVVRFKDLDQEDVCGAIFEHCLGMPHDHGWWSRWAPLNVQCDLRAILRYSRAYASQMTLAGRLALAELRPQRMRILIPGAEDGIDICEEPIARFMADGHNLFAEHCIAVGEPPDQHTRKNIPLIEALAAAGRMQIITARSNGRLLAYLCSFFAESLEEVGLITATQTLFFSSEDAPSGLGLRLQRAAIAESKRRGVGEIYMRAGVRGSGPKLGILYRRLGAREHGMYWKLDLREAA